MNEIRLLPKSISDKIAAGEVVERPASVVKELVENAIDAKASAVSISISGGGIREISVADNGVGIASDDVRLAFEKHATSKLYTLGDLEYISTQGFRGEALSSIAAVSIAEMKTKRRDEETGTQIRVSGGRLDYAKPAGLPDGTSVNVSNLFYNVPARRKFLRKESQEAAYVSDLVSRYILAFPEISFHYTSEGKTIYHSPGNGDLSSAIYCVYGSAALDTIVFVQHQTNDIQVSGYVSRPGAIMKNRKAGSVFVNRRYVRNTALHDMVKSAYGETLVKGETPFFVLNIELPFSAVDVNVHPNKLQVRFKDTSAVEYVIKEAVSKACAAPRGSVFTDAAEPQKRSVVEMRAPEGVQEGFFSGFNNGAPIKPKALWGDNSGAPIKPKALWDDSSGAPILNTFWDENRNVLKEQETANADANAYDISAQSSAEPELQKHEQPESPAAQTEAAKISVQSYRLIGSFGATYALVEQGDDLLIVDQHAAHERLLYEKFKSSKAPLSQALLYPYVFTASHEQKNVLDDNMEAFIAAGFDIEPFGALEYKISAVPSIASGAAPGELINDALAEIQSGGDVVLKREAIIKAACRSAVKAGDKMSEAELKSLVDSFLTSGVMPTCPHGRPVISVISRKQIEKSFKRTV
ncbi:MAG: DNA mismatch repair endonuclease MutL [Burkholderiales bacterium]